MKPAILPLELITLGISYGNGKLSNSESLLHLSYRLLSPVLHTERLV